MQRRSRRRPPRPAGDVHGSLRSRRAGCGTRLCGPARTGRGGEVGGRGRRSLEGLRARRARGQRPPTVMMMLLMTLMMTMLVAVCVWGSLQSRPRESIRKEIEELAAAGYKEVLPMIETTESKLLFMVFLFGYLVSISQGRARRADRGRGPRYRGGPPEMPGRGRVGRGEPARVCAFA